VVGNSKGTVAMINGKLEYIFKALVKLKYGGYGIFTSQYFHNVLESLGCRHKAGAFR
jgi:hypothetical protein